MAVALVSRTDWPDPDAPGNRLPDQKQRDGQDSSLRQDSAPGFVQDGMGQVGGGPVKLPDETALRRRLHEEIDLSDMRSAPVDAVFRRYRATASPRLMSRAYRRRFRQNGAAPPGR